MQHRTADRAGPGPGRDPVRGPGAGPGAVGIRPPIPGRGRGPRSISCAGSGRWAVLLLLPAVVVAAGFAFAVTIGEFGATVFLASPADPTLPVAISRLLARPGSDRRRGVRGQCRVLMLITAAVVVGMDRVRLSRAVAF